MVVLSIQKRGDHFLSLSDAPPCSVPLLALGETGQCVDVGLIGPQFCDISVEVVRLALVRVPLLLECGQHLAVDGGSFAVFGGGHPFGK